MSYIPRLYPTIDWDQAVSRYGRFQQAWPELAPMHDFVSSLAASPYAPALYPHTSLFSLILVQVEAFEYGRDMIELLYLPQQQLFHLQYWERPDVDPGWQRLGPDPWLLMVNLLRALGWFPALLPRPYQD